MKLYVVQGSSREYSDGWSWLIAAYTNEEAANQHCELANQYLKIRPKPYQDRQAFNKWVNDNPYDKSRNEDVNDYEVLEVDLFRHVDEYQELK